MSDLTTLVAQIRSGAAAYDLPARRLDLAAFDTETHGSGFWDDQRRASAVVRRAETIRTEIARWERLLAKAVELEAAVSDPELAIIVADELPALEREARAARRSY